MKQKIRFRMRWGFGGFEIEPADRRQWVQWITSSKTTLWPVIGRVSQ